eukprot:4594343-Pyramimonas_sp.AAC.1
MSKAETLLKEALLAEESSMQVADLIRRDCAGMPRKPKIPRQFFWKGDREAKRKKHEEMTSDDKIETVRSNNRRMAAVWE